MSNPTNHSPASKAQAVRMTIFRCDDLTSWQDRVIAAARTQGAEAIRKGSACNLWRSELIREIPGSCLRYVDGVRLVRESVSANVGAITILPRRMYFEADADTPTSKPERILVGDRRLALPSPSARISTCLEWAARIAKGLPGFNPEPMPIVRARHGLHEKTRIIVGSGASAAAGCKLSQLYMAHGFYSVPENFRILVAGPRGAEGKTTQYATLLTNALRRCRTTGSISTASYEALSSRLEPGQQAWPTGAVVLLGVTGRKGDAITPAASDLIGRMTQQGVSFRLFSVENPSLQWSALDQLGSLVAAAGGLPHVVDLPWPDPNLRPFLLGVDLGHPLQGRFSRVAMSLLDAQGSYIGSWRQVQGRDETIGLKTLAAGLRWVANKAREISGEKDPAFLVLRDGRLHKGERVESYRRILGRRMTFVEFAKYENPENYLDGQDLRPVNGGTECVLEAGEARYITPISPRLAGDLARTFKHTMRDGWDGLGLGMDTVSEILVGLSYTPGLGLAAHALPGPIYWADGIAAIGETNHQFAGLALT